jgi:hypothetical protein
MSPRDERALELSTAGTGGPWTAVKNGDVVTRAQLAYHLRLTMNASADQRRAPLVSALGIEFRNRIDLSAESTVEPMSQEVAVPFLAAVDRRGQRHRRAHGPARLPRRRERARHGGPDTQIECDVYLGSRHPQVTRDDWFHTTRALVSTGSRRRRPSGCRSSRSRRRSSARSRRGSSRSTPCTPSSASRRRRRSRVASAAARGRVDERATSTTGGATTSASGKSAAGPRARTDLHHLGQHERRQARLHRECRPDALKELPAAFFAGDEIEVHSGSTCSPR